jgi:hypothetical protein
MRYGKPAQARVVVMLIASVAAGTLTSTPKAAPATVAVTITDSALRLSRTTFVTGEVSFDVTNRGKRRHEFRIAGIATPNLAPGQSATVKIVFTQGGKFRYVVPGLRAGAVSVRGTTAPAGSTTTTAASATTTTSTSSAEPCANPTTSTVTVTITDAPSPHGYTFTPSTVSCGTITFVLKNVGSTPHGLQLMDPTGTILPASQTVLPSQTATMVSNLKYVGSYEWIDSVSTDNFAEAEPGFLTVQ